MEKIKEKFNPLVSIIIPVYNGANYMREAIDSALNQTYKNIEVVVVNDGSSDDTDKIARSYGNKIRYFKKENGGVATSLNFGIAKMSGDYFSWLSHDDVYLPEKIEKQIDFLSKLEDKNSILYCNVRYIDNNSNSVSYTSYESKYSYEELNNGFFCLLHGYANGCAMLIPKACFDKIGLFNETTRTSNDYEMWMRLFRKYDVRFVPDILIEYRLHDGQDTNTSPVYQKESSQLWKKIIQELKESEVLSFSKNLFNFYFSMALQMKESQCMEAYEISYQKAREYFSSTQRKVSIIMPCFNTEKYLSEAIDSILKQTFCDFELIIVDDNSTDSSLDIIKTYAEKDFRIIFSKNINEKGISGAMNTGLKLANGEYITRMDSDDISLQQRLEKQVFFLDENSSYGICSVNISSMDSSGKTLSESLFSETSVPLEWLFLWKNPIANAPAMYRKEIIKRNSTIFNISLKSAEDYDFLCKNILHTKCFQISEPLYKYRIHNESVFQKNINDTCEKSVLISRRLAKEITGEDPPIFHDELTVFLFDVKKATEKYDTREVELWMNKLLNNSKKQWHWNDDEYNSAFNDASKRVKDYILQQSIPNDHKEEITNNSENINILNTENLQISDNDLIGNKFNGHDLHFYLRNRDIDSKQLVWNKKSVDNNTFEIARNRFNREEIYSQILLMQKQYSLNGILNPLGYDILCDPLFLNTNVVHLHLMHNNIFDIQLLPLMSRLKPILWTLHDPWALGGHCIHHFECEKWKKQCGDCPNLDVPFGLGVDNSSLNFAFKKDAIRNSNLEIIVASEWMKKKVEQSPIFEGKKINVIPFGINQEIFRPITKKDARKKLGISEDALVISFRCDYSGFKGMDFIENVLDNIRSKNKIVLLVLAYNLRKKYKNFEIKKYGWVKDDKLLAHIYSASDLFLMPSVVESFGMMAIEAMSCGTLPIVLEGTALPDTINAPECGVSVKRDKGEYLKAVQYFINHEKERIKRAEKCLEFAKNNYDKDAYVEKIMKVYDKALKEHNISEEDQHLLNQLKKNVPAEFYFNRESHKNFNKLDFFERKIDLLKHYAQLLFLKYKNVVPKKMRILAKNNINKLMKK